MKLCFSLVRKYILYIFYFGFVTNAYGYDSSNVPIPKVKPMLGKPVERGSQDNLAQANSKSGDFSKFYPGGVTSKQCPDLLRKAIFTDKRPFRNAKGCGARYPVEILGLGNKSFSTKMVPKAITNCKFALRLAYWHDNVLQPTAQKYFGEKVASIRNYASYACRTRNNKRGTKMSEHSYANALDIASFTFTSGRKITVLEDWDSRVKNKKVLFSLSGKPSKGSMFLREIHKRSCKVFGTVLGPEANKYHKDHFHFDLMSKGVCE